MPHPPSPVIPRFLAAFLVTCALITGLPAYEFEAGAAVAEDATTRISLDSQGNQAAGHSFHPSVSADGRYVAFSSRANNLVPNDTNGREDIFVHDRSTGTTTLVSVSSSGVQANYESLYPSISADGKHVSFRTLSNLVPDDTNDSYDIYVHDLDTAATERASVGNGGQQATGVGFYSSISQDGRYVAFDSGSPLTIADNNGRSDVFVRDRTLGFTTRVSVPAPGGSDIGWSEDASISADGRYVAFTSSASLVPDAGWARNIYVRDLIAGQTVLASVSSDGVPGNSNSGDPYGDSDRAVISADGRHVAFKSAANNLVPGDGNLVSDVFMRNLTRRHPARLCQSRR